jgi:hypothetical protein
LPRSPNQSGRRGSAALPKDQNAPRETAGRFYFAEGCEADEENMQPILI